MTEHGLVVGRLAALGDGHVDAPDRVEELVGDLPSARDRRSALPAALRRLGLFSAVIGLLTAGAVIGTGYAVSDVIVLIGAQLLVSLAIWRIPWRAVDESWLVVAIAVQLLFVSTLIGLTGGGQSPHYALYAPVLAIAGWHLRTSQVVLAVAMMGATELWRAFVVEPTPQLGQLAVALPTYALVAALAHVSGRRHAEWRARSRLDQLRIATTLRAIRAMAAGEDPSMTMMGRAAGDVFEAEGWIVTPGEMVPDDAPHHCRRAGSDHAIVPIRSGGAEYGWLRLCRRAPFSSTERRLAAVLTEAIGRAMQDRASQAELRADPRRDPTTGLLSRTSFEVELAHLMNRTTYFGEHVSLFLVQILASRRNWGQATDDETLIGRIGRAMRTQLADGDQVYRFADGAIAVTARGVDEHESVVLAERLRSVARDVVKRAAETGGSELGVGVGLGRGVIGATSSIALIELTELDLRRGDADRYVPQGRQTGTMPAHGLADSS